MRSRRQSLRTAFAGALLGALLAAGVAGRAIAAEDTTITAFSAWVGEGRIYETGADELTFVGALAGVLYIETEKGPVASGRMVCPTSIKVNTKDRSQFGVGHCTIAGPEGDRVYAQIACDGYFLVGCNGTFTITGGTGRFSKIEGEGPVLLRSDFGRLTADENDPTRQTATGILYLKELRYKIP